MAPDPHAAHLADAVLDKLLAQYSAVEPPPAALDRWMAHRADPLPTRRYFWLPAPAWAAIAALLLLILGMSWYRLSQRAADTRARLAAGEKTVIVPLNPAPPLSARDKQLIQLLQTNPAALATQQPDPPKVKHP